MLNSAVIFIEVGMKNSNSITTWTERKYAVSFYSQKSIYTYRIMKTVTLILEFMGLHLHE